MEARHLNRHRMMLWAGLWVAASILWVAAAQSQGLQPRTTPGRILLRLNAGGPTVAAIDRGPDWVRDAGFFGGGTRVVTGRTVSGLDRSVPVTTPRDVFFTERFNPPNTPNMTYDLPVEAGTRVELRLYFMNGFRGTSEPGERVFDILVDGHVAVNDLDLSDQFGHQVGGMHALVLESDGEINIEFDREIQAPLISAIEVVEAEVGHPTPVAGVLYRLNAGGPTMASIDEGPDWISDAGFHGGGARVVTGRNVRGIDRSVLPSTPRGVFFTERFNPPNTPNMTYDLPVAPGTRIELRLYVMNGFQGTSERGERVFDVSVDGHVVLNDVDLSDTFGHQIGGVFVIELTSDDEINIEFHREVQAPLINAIEVVERDGDGGGGPPVAGVLYRVNAGGSRVRAIDEGPDWERDAGFFGGGTRVVTGRNVRDIDPLVPPSTPEAVFFTERFNPPNTSNMTYRFPVPAGIRVIVRLYMMNGFAGTSQPGQRVFDVSIDGVRVMRDIDLSDEFGHQIAGMRSATVLTDGELDIEFHRDVQAPLVNAIEVIEADETPVVSINPRRSLIETSPPVLAGFNMRTILRTIAQNSGITPAPERGAYFS